MVASESRSTECCSVRDILNKYSQSENSDKKTLLCELKTATRGTATMKSFFRETLKNDVEALLEAVCGDDVALRQASAMALAALTKPVYGRSFLASFFLDRVVECAKLQIVDDPGMKWTLGMATTLTNLASQAKHQKRLIDLGGLSLMYKWVDFEDKRLLYIVATGLLALSLEESTRVRILDSNGLQYLAILARSEDERTRLIAASAVAKLHEVIEVHVEMKESPRDHHEGWQHKWRRRDRILQWRQRMREENKKVDVETFKYPLNHPLVRNKHLSILQNDQHLGSSVWDAAIMLARFIEGTDGAKDSEALSIAGKKVIELGCGTGVTGLVAAALGGEVKVTELPFLKDIIEQNIAANANVTSLNGGSVSFGSLDWLRAQDEWDEEVVERVENGGYDVILIADCVFQKSLVDGLFRTMQAVASKKGCEVILAYGKNRNQIVEYIELMNSAAQLIRHQEYAMECVDWFRLPAASED